MSSEARPVPRHHRRGFVFPVILIVVGVLLLLNYLDVLPWGIWSSLWRFWPVVLILIGLDLIVGRRAHAWVAAPALLLLGAGLIGGLVWYYWGWAPPSVVTREVVQPLGSLQQARVELDFGTGTLKLRSLPTSSQNLLEGDVTGAGDQAGMEKLFTATGSGGTLRLSAQRLEGMLFPNRRILKWDLRLSRRAPLTIDLDAGAADMDLDLADLLVRDLNLSVGGSSVSIAFPEAAGRTTAIIKGGAASIHLTIPRGVAARIHHSGGLSSFRVDEQRFVKNGNVYESAGYATATNRLDLTLQTGVSSISVR